MSEAEANAAPDADRGDGPGTAGGAAGGGGFDAVLNHMKADKLEAALWFSRILNMVFTVLYIIPLVGDPSSHYQKSLIAGGAISAFRLQSRMPRVTLSREFVRGLVKEDSFHYLIFCVIFLTMAGPGVTMSLMPVFMFSLLHVTKYTGILLNCLGPQSIPFVRSLLLKLDGNQRTLLRFIACNEIFLMPMTVVLIFSGQAALFLPFLYYQFLCMRYTSQRNPYNRQLFAELRMAAVALSQHQSCPAMAANLIHKMIALVSKLAPNVPAT